LDAIVVVAVVLAVPALAVAGIASAVAHWRGKRRGESTEELGRRIRRAFWLAFLITAGLEIIAFGLCIASLGEIG
jgi:hypothetical protein